MPVEMLKEWIDESYRAQAPKKLLKQLEGGAAPAPAKNPRRNPCRSDVSRMRREMPPTGIAIPYPARSPSRKIFNKAAAPYGERDADRAGTCTLTEAHDPNSPG